jgi:ATP-dependent exoDNAse (exonuclease V) beta subunit
MYEERVEIYSDRTNAVVLRHHGRKHPGVLVQGDALFMMFQCADAACEAAKREDAAEDMRLLYVGLTRARDAMWLATGPLASNTQSSLHRLLGGVLPRIDVPGLDPLSAVVPEARFDANPVVPGQPVVLSWTPRDVHVLGR